MEWTIPYKSLKGHAGYIIGGGPSILDIPSNFWNEILPPKYTICTNNAYRLVKRAHYTLFLDHNWGKVHLTYDEYKNHPGLKITTNPNFSNHPDIKWLEKHDFRALSDDPKKLSNGYNSGFAALNLAYLLGLNPIFLFGFDMHTLPTGQTHWHEGHMDVTKRPTDPKTYANVFIPLFDEVEPVLKAKGVDVFNCNPHSSLQTFPRVSWRVAHTWCLRDTEKMEK